MREADFWRRGADEINHPAPDFGLALAQNLSVARLGLVPLLSIKQFLSGQPHDLVGFGSYHQRRMQEEAQPAIIPSGAQSRDLTMRAEIEFRGISQEQPVSARLRTGSLPVRHADGCKRHLVAGDQAIGRLAFRPHRRLPQCAAARVVHNLRRESHGSLRASCVSKITTAELFLRPILRGQCIRSQRNPSLTSLRARSVAPLVAVPQPGHHHVSIRGPKKHGSG
jgi:hypothetical protein